MFRHLQFVDEGDGKVLHRYTTVARSIHEQLIIAKPELSSSCAGREFDRWR
jgi:hypothetical protein